MICKKNHFKGSRSLIDDFNEKNAGIVYYNIFGKRSNLIAARGRWEGVGGNYNFFKLAFVSLYLCIGPVARKKISFKFTFITLLTFSSLLNLTILRC